MLLLDSKRGHSSGFLVKGMVGSWVRLYIKNLHDDKYQGYYDSSKSSYCFEKPKQNCRLVIACEKNIWEED